MIRRVTLGLAAVGAVLAAFVLPRAPAAWLDDLCPPAQVEAVA